MQTSLPKFALQSLVLAIVILIALRVYPARTLESYWRRIERIDYDYEHDYEHEHEGCACVIG